MHLGIFLSPEFSFRCNAPDILPLSVLTKKLVHCTLNFTQFGIPGDSKAQIFVPKISLQSINTRSACYERWVHFKKLTGGKSLEPVYGRLWKGTSEKSRLGDVRILLLLSSLILFHISQALTLSASVSRFKAKCNTSIFHLRVGGVGMAPAHLRLISKRKGSFWEVRG